ncbi:MAG: hypothetical protein ABJO27_19150 [Pseudoruegeria sp.]
MSDTPNNARIEVFRPGTFTPSAGKPIEFSTADLKAIADAYDPDSSPAPIVVGHPNMDAPAYGWIKGLEFDEQSERLFADLHEIEPQFADLVKQGRYKKVSMAFFAPTQSANPNPGAWYPKHVGFLGGAAPAVSGLKNVEFSTEEAVTFTADFGERGFEEAASLLRSLREWMIDRFGKEEADEVLPTYKIEWLGDTEIETPEPARFADPKPQPAPEKKPKKEPVVTKETDEAAFAAREAKLKAREIEIAKKEKEQAHEGNVSFAEGLVETGKLLPVNKDKVVAVLDALPPEASVTFADGEDKIPPADAIRDILEAQPEVVSFGALDLPDSPSEGRGDPDQVASFAMTYLKQQREAGKEISISDAVEHVTKGALK